MQERTKRIIAASDEHYKNQPASAPKEPSAVVAFPTPNHSDTPPAPESAPASSERSHVSTLEQAVRQLKSVMTKPLTTFAAAQVSRD
jgi:hypothetical protein